MSSPALAILLLGSGLSALVYQTLWVKQVTLTVGVEVEAVTTVVSAFFAGLAVGSALLGPRADATARPLLFYAALEAGIAVLAAVVTLALGGLAPLYARAAATVGDAARLLPFLLIAAPAVLMGGTLPAAVRALSPARGRLGAAGGALYAANTAGAVAGALLTVFVLVPALGVRGSALAAAALNGVLAIVAAVLARGPTVPPAPQTAGAGAGSALALGLYALAGAVALGCEIVWSQAVVPFMNTRAYAFALVLATYLTGLVAGSVLFARLADGVARPWLLFGALELAIGASALAGFAVLGPGLAGMQVALADTVLAATGSMTAAVGAQMLLAPVALLLLPALLLGAAFPAVVRLACGPDHVGRDVGAVAAASTAGGIAGTIFAGFVGIPAVGVQGTLIVLAVGAATIGGIALVKGAARRGPVAAGAALAVAATLAGGLAIPRDHLARVLVATRGGTLVAHDESPGGSVTVLQEPFQEGHFRRLYIQGVSNSGDNLMARRYMRLQALVPLLVHQGDSRRALVIGLGTGITCGTLLTWPTLERRECVELLPAVVRLVHHFDGNLDVVHNPLAEIRVGDGRHDLLVRPDTYDVITLEPPPPIAAGVVNLYSRDFYDLCRSRLAPHGIMGQWLPLATQNAEDTASLVRTFLDAFPHAQLWTTELHETLLVGSMEPIVLDVPIMAARFAVPEVAGVLAQVGLPDLASVLATYVTDRDGLSAFAGDALPTTDDRPRIEYAGLTRPGEFARVLMQVFDHRREPPLVAADEALWVAMRATRDRLLAFYRGALLYYAGQREEMEAVLQKVFDEEPDNPYYRWFIGG